MRAGGSRSRRRWRSRAVVAGTVVGGAVLGWFGERFAARGLRNGSDPEAADLARPVRGQPRRVVASDGTGLHVEILGPDEAPTIVLVHGYTNDQRTWHYQRRDLAGEFRIVTYDQRGHGASDEAVGGDYTMDALAGDLAAVLEACVPASQPVVVAGHSLGGMSALALVDNHGELLGTRIAGLALVSTSGSDIVAGILGASMTGLQSLATAVAPRVVGLRGRLGATPTDLTYLGIRALTLCRQASPAHVAFAEGMSLACPAPVRAALLPTFTSLDLTAAARQIGVPALVIAGDRDRLTPPSSARALADLLPDARLVELPGVGHMAPLEAHETVTVHLRVFARRLLAGPA